MRKRTKNRRMIENKKDAKRGGAGRRGEERRGEERRGGMWFDLIEYRKVDG